MKRLRQFLGSLAFYHKFIKDLSKVMSPLYNLQAEVSKSKRHWQWNSEHRRAFSEAKRLLADSVPLNIPKFGKLMELTTDASDFALGAALHQEGKPLGYFSKKLSGSEKHYRAFDKELYSIYLSMKNFEYLLEGCKIILRTDHKPLLHVFTMKEPTKKQLRWISYISEFDIDIEHIKGKDNAMADMLSRYVNLNKIETMNFTTSKELGEEQRKDRSIMDIVQIKNHSLEIINDNGVFFDISRGKHRILLPPSLREREIRFILLDIQE